MQQRFDYLDGWRGLAISFLLVGHFFSSYFFGQLGVNLFFVLSGLLMGRILFLQKVPLPVFYQRRISRIMPAVLVFLTVVTITYFAAGNPVHWDEVLTAVLFLKNYFFVGSDHGTMPFAHIWSLCVEEHSYVVLSIAALGFRKQLSRPKVMLWMLAAFTAVMAVTYSIKAGNPKFLPWQMLIRTEVSAFGILVSAALLVTLDGKRIAMPRFTIPALFVFGLAMNWYWRVPDALRLIVGVGSLALAVNLLSQAPRFVQSTLSFKPLRQIGIWSFSIYLWQQPFYVAVRQGELSPWLGLPMALIAGIASFYLVEQPAREFLNRNWTYSPAGSISPSAKNR